LVSADYSQIELRLMAELSQDPVLIDAFNNDLDVHRDTAARIFGIDVDQVTDEQRGQAKTVNFGILYGQGPFGLSKTLGISQAEAKAFIEEYKKTYKGVMQYLESTVKDAYENGFVTTILHRRRMLPGLHAKPGPARAAAERLAINAPIQGSAADLIKVAMVNLDHKLAERGLSSRMVVQVHDELLLECPENEADEAADMVREAMTSAIKFDVAVTVNVGVGNHWEEIH
jgi:DNA polymerase-1